MVDGRGRDVRRLNAMTEHQRDSEWNIAEWHGKMLLDRDGEKIGKLQDVYVDVETDEPQFATVKEGLISRHLTFVPLGSPKPTSRRSTTTTSSTTAHPTLRADADWRAAEATSHPRGRRARQREPWGHPWPLGPSERGLPLASPSSIREALPVPTRGHGRGWTLPHPRG
jgi:hypothetical protein